MALRNRSLTRISRTALGVAMLVLTALVSWGQVSYAFDDDFENGVGWWSFEGVWDLGSPLADPAGGFESVNCVGTVLDGDYPAAADARLVTPPFSVPSPSGGESVYLDFANWFALGAGDSVFVEISDDNGLNWTRLGNAFAGHSMAWTHYRAEIAAIYYGQTVNVAFHIVDNGSVTGNTHGFFLDNVVVAAVATPVMADPAGFETGLAGWSTQSGTWQIGAPAGGPMGGFAGSANCAGTVLANVYDRYASGRLVSPLVTVNTPAPGNATYLTFQHWAELAGQDQARVEISMDGVNWQTVAENLVRTDDWQQAFVDVSLYAGQNVHFGFRVVDDGGAAVNSDGWYIDEVGQYEGPIADWTQMEDFESGIAGWSVEGSVWEIGVPTAGPAVAVSGTKCAGTNLDGPYSGSDNARLVSPMTVLPSVGAGEFIRLSFWQWFSHVDWDDYLDVQVRLDGGSWVQLQRIYSLTSEDWSRMMVDLTAYQGQAVQVSFRLYTDAGAGGVGWYLDDINLVLESANAWSLDGFESGQGNWSSDGGTWQVGVPTAGPDTTHAGLACAGTNLDGNYDIYGKARLISPISALPAVAADERLVLDFWHWFQHVDWDDDLYVQIRPENGSWTTLQQVVSLMGEDWTHMTIDMTAYAGQNAQVGFYISTDGGGSDLGWYIDEVNIGVVATDFWSLEDFESGTGNWGSTGGSWQVGVPTSGPGSAFAGEACAATNLDGDYEAYVNSRLVSPFVALPDTNEIKLSYWQWFRHEDWDDDFYIDIKGDAGNWVNIYHMPSLISEDWTRNMLDISDYRGQVVQIAFRAYTDGEASPDKGWYVDNVEFILGVPDSWTEIDFEGGIDGWSATNGTWEIGVPESGPGAAHSGTSCAATNLSGDYQLYDDTRLVSPSTYLNPTPQDGILQISFWQWFHHVEWGEGVHLQIRTAQDESKATWNSWQTVYTQASLYSEDWTKASFDISAFAGQNVQFAWYLRDNWSGRQYPGWYIDDVAIVEGAAVAGVDERISFNFEDPQVEYGGWSTDNASWQVGVPDYENGPPGGNSGQRCAGTNLDGDYQIYADTRLVSPPIILAAPNLNSSDGTYWMSFWQWYSRSAWADYMDLQIKVDDGAWTSLNRITPLYDTGWTRSVVDLSAYAGQKIQIGFYLNDDNAGGQAAGWYVDDVEFFGGTPHLVSPDNFALSDWGVANLGGWGSDNGTWEIGRPVYSNGPDAAFEGEICAGTAMTNNYQYSADSRFTSTTLSLPTSPLGNQMWFSFWHWYNFYGGDTGRLEISVDDGAWSQIGETYVRNSGGWSQQIVDLSPYLGSDVKLAFHLKDDKAGSAQTAAGWYIDKVSLVEGPKPFNNSEGFETRTKGWSAEAGSWQLGSPTAGPSTAFSGSGCAGTVLDGNYPRYAHSRLVSPSFVLGAAPMVRYRQWFNLAAGDSLLFEISAAGGPWEQLEGFTTSANWTQYARSLAAYAGQEVRVAFRLRDNGDGSESEGAYIDDLEFLDVPTGQPTPPVFDEVTYSTGAPVLNWTVTAPDHQWLAIYAGHVLSIQPDTIEEYVYTPDFGNRVQLTTAANFADNSNPYWRAGYMISSINSLGQESELVGPGAMTPVLDQPLWGGPVLSQNYPNPFNPATRIQLNLAAPAKLSLTVFDLAGRRVKSLISATVVESGSHEITWAGLDDAGLPVAAGVYFYKLETDGFSETKRMLLVK